MHNAPSVSYPVGRSRFCALLSLLLWLTGLAAVIAWSVLVTSPVWRQALVLGVAVGAGGVATWGWWHQPTGVLAWDGQAWRWRGLVLATAAAPAVVLDLQSFMLLRLPQARRGQWLWLERTHAPPHWRALRRAVYSRARIELPTDGIAGPATP